MVFAANVFLSLIVYACVPLFYHAILKHSSQFKYHWINSRTIHFVTPSNHCATISNNDYLVNRLIFVFWNAFRTTLAWNGGFVLRNCRSITIQLVKIAILLQSVLLVFRVNYREPKIVAVPSIHTSFIAWIYKKQHTLCPERYGTRVFRILKFTDCRSSLYPSIGGSLLYVRSTYYTFEYKI